MTGAAQGSGPVGRGRRGRGGGRLTIRSRSNDEGPSRLLARIEARELALKPKARIFVFVDLGADAANAAREATRR